MVSELRIKAAEILSEKLGIDVDPERVEPVTGYYKYQDVYRWEVSFDPHRGRNINLGCWERLSEFVRNAKNGVVFSDLSGNRVNPKTCRGPVEVSANEPAIAAKLRELNGETKGQTE